MKNIKIVDDMILKTCDNRLEAFIKYWSYNDNKGVIISIVGEFKDGIELSKFILPTFSENIDSFIIDFSNYKYVGGDRFFDWYYFLKDFYSDISLIESENGCPTELAPLFPKDKLVLVYSDLCKTAIESLIEDEKLVELQNRCFDSIEDALYFIKNV